MLGRDGISSATAAFAAFPARKCRTAIKPIALIVDTKFMVLHSASPLAARNGQWVWAAAHGCPPADTNRKPVLSASAEHNQEIFGHGTEQKTTNKRHRVVPEI